MFEKQIKEDKNKMAKLEDLITEELAEAIYKLAIYEAAPLAFGMRTFKELEEKEIRSLKRIIAASQSFYAAEILT